MFVFGGVTHIANSVGHLVQVESFAPGQIMRFSSMEYTVDLREELIFSGLVSRQVEEQHESLPLALMSDLAEKEREKPFSGSMSYRVRKPFSLVLMSHQTLGEREKSLSGLTSGRIPKPLFLGMMSDQAQDDHENIPWSMSDQTLKPLPLVPMSDRTQEECEESLSGSMSDQVLKSRPRTWNQIRPRRSMRNFS